MESERIVKDYEKLDTEEVNVYTNDCGITRRDCVTDCIGGSAWISTMNYYKVGEVLYRRLQINKIPILVVASRYGHNQKFEMNQGGFL